MSLLCFASTGSGSHDSVLKEILSEKDVLENITLAFGLNQDTSTQQLYDDLHASKAELEA